MPFRLSNSNDFDTKDLSKIDFCLEAIIENESSYKCFTEYLTSTHNLEMALFLNATNEYKLMRSESNKIKKAKEIINEFIKEDSKNQLNISGHLKQKIIEACEKEDKTILASNLFEELEFSILISLKEHVFGDFLKSELFLKFLKSVGIEALLDLGVINGRVPHTMKDSIINLKTDHFVIQDVEFLKSVLTSDLEKEWDLIQSSSHHKLYSSKQIYEFGSIPHDKMIRVEMEFQCEAIELIHTLFNSKLRKVYDINLKNVELLTYIPARKISEQQLASSMALETQHLYFPLADREFPMIYTCVKDKYGNYIVCKKSCEAPEVVPLPKKGVVRAIQVHGILVQPIIGEGKCKFSKVVMIDFKGSVPRSMIINYFKQRFKSMHKEITKLLERNEKKDYRCDHKVLNTLEENGVFEV
ncbi:hypothetical protein ABK040_000046 [Willaertia magna]